MEGCHKMDTKPLYIDGLTQEQRTRYVRCASLNGQKLNAWVAEVLDREAVRLLAHEDRPKPEPWHPPTWAEGLSRRAVEVLQRAGLDSREAVAQAVTDWTPATWYALPNCGHRVYVQVCQWVNSNS